MQALKSAQGFPFDLRTPGLDVIADCYARSAFGEDNVASIKGVLHRSVVTTDRMITDLHDFDRSYGPASSRDDPVYQLAFCRACVISSYRT